MDIKILFKTINTAANSTYPKGGVSCSKDSLVVTGTLVLLINFCGKSPALRVAAKRCEQEVLFIFLVSAWRDVLTRRAS